jgi:hypothetical protein
MKRGAMNPQTVQAARQLQRQVEQQRALLKSAKNAVLHLRIEEAVMERIKAEAALRKMSVSDLVRCHLAEHFAPDSGDGEAPAFLRETFAWSDAVIMQDSQCALCQRAMPRGTNARLANGPPPPARLVCGPCYDGIQLNLGGHLQPEEGIE